MTTLAPRTDFPLLASLPDLVYLDSAATSQKPRVVLDAIRAYYEHDNANPHRGAYALSVRATERYHGARARIARFLGVADADTVIFTRGTTESINLVAATWGRRNVSAGDTIIVTGAEHHANFVPWQQLARERSATLRIVELEPDGTLDLDRLSAALDDRARIVAFSHVSNVLGSINPVREIARLAHRVGAIAVCDGAQAAPHMALELDQLDVDFYAASGHKMLGPMGIGVLVGRRSLLERMPPFLMGGDMIEFVHDYDATWNRLPHKFEAGTPNVEGAVGLATACDYLEALGMERVREHERALVQLAWERLTSIEGITLFGPPPPERAGVLSFTLADVHPHDLSSILDARGICIRAGHHCAQPLMRRLGVPATARASVYVYSGEHDIDALVAGLHEARAIFGYVGQ